MAHMGDAVEGAWGLTDMCYSRGPQRQVRRPAGACDVHGYGVKLCMKHEA